MKKPSRDAFEVIADLATDEQTVTKADLAASLSQEGHDVPKFLERVRSVVRTHTSKNADSTKHAGIPHRHSSRDWKHPSVVHFAGGEDAVAKIVHKASQVALEAIQRGWAGPPFDPFALAEILRISVVPNSQIMDARTVPLRGNKVQIEYNPNRPRPRMRYSLAHEIAHTFFEDCAEAIRNRAAKKDFAPDEWELEMLCNIAAAELLMPIGSISEESDQPLSIKRVIELRKAFEVSTESIMLRLIRITKQPCTMFIASRCSDELVYTVDYSIPSRTSPSGSLDAFRIPEESVVATCTAMGFSASAEEDWKGVGECRVEAYGISPYPDSIFPRVLGLVLPHRSGLSASSIRYVTGDATQPVGAGRKILAHVVNDATPNWGAGFGRAVQKKWPDVQKRFRDWWEADGRKRLGEMFCSQVDHAFSICQMICQRGYGPSSTPRLRYAALRECLTRLRDHAFEANASVHMPRIGSGEAGGSWGLVSALIDEVLCASGVEVTIYDLPFSKRQEKQSPQTGLFDER